ncbi:hypothetical protein TRAPUB_6054 [Trametes pubescens]|uniref:Uncharacterized protein n=1 Tax=Trametes pubescens TaxID=154538 RepID=A0A1M2V732_TRAPU|nr:hypothetical protein TRAPUB_6054 [Trametes pubescens]
MSSRILDLTLFGGTRHLAQEMTATYGDAVTTSQTVWYFKHYSSDRRVLRFLVAIIWLLDALHLALYLVTMFIYLVQKKGAFFGQQPLPWRSRLVSYSLSKKKSLLVVMAIFVTITFVYSVSLLGTLNARESLRWEAQNMGRFPLPDIQITVPVTPKRTLSDSMPHFHGLSLGLHCDTPSTYGSISSGDTRVYCDGHRCYALPPDMELGLDKRQSMDISESRIGTRTDPGEVVIVEPDPYLRRTVSG